MPGSPPDTWLVVPCYNEALRLPVAAFAEFLREHRWLRICLVNDGSRDATAGVLGELAASCGSQAVVLDLTCNRGKAEAVRQGVLHALALDEREFIGYWDADLATPLSELHRFFQQRRECPKAEALIGCRLRRMGAKIDRSTSRHALGRVFATIASLILGLPCYDTQCGAKLFHGSLARAIFAAPFLTSWCFDVELLARIRALRGCEQALECVVEVPLMQWLDVAGSKLRLQHYVRAAVDLWRIFVHYRQDSAVVASFSSADSGQSPAKDADRRRAA